MTDWYDTTVVAWNGDLGYYDNCRQDWGEHLSLSIAILEEEAVDILLGETMYFQAVDDPNDPDELLVEEVEVNGCTAPSLDGGRSDALWAVAKEQGDRVGVYNDGLRWGCIDSGGTVRGGELPPGLIEGWS